MYSSKARSWEHLIKPYKISFSKEHDQAYTETMVWEPLEPGFGHTIGVSLRRILLSSLQGSAVTSVKIAGTFLEFSSLPGVVEDVTDIVLNLKSLDVRLDSLENSHVFRVQVKGPCVVTAESIQTEGRLTVLDPTQVICTVNDGAVFDAELTVSRGKGYVTVPLAGDRKILGEILLDARFNPVKKVSYSVESARVAQSTDYDRLLMTVQTNGSISPRDAVVEAARILRDQLTRFASLDVDHQDGASETRLRKTGNQVLPPILFMRLKDLDLPPRCVNALQKVGVVYVGDLVKKREVDLLRTPSIGKQSMTDIKDNLAQKGLSLGMDSIDWPPPDRMDLVS